MVLLVMVSLAVATVIEQNLEVQGLRSVLPQAEKHRPARPVDGSQASLPPPVVAPAQPPAEMSAETPVAPPEPVAVPAPGLTVGSRARVANTDGLGVVLHSAPSAGARQPAGLLEGTAITVVERAGEDWVRVESDSRQAGWVPASYLVPGAP